MNDPDYWIHHSRYQVDDTYKKKPRKITPKVLLDIAAMLFNTKPYLEQHPGTYAITIKLEIEIMIEFLQDVREKMLKKVYKKYKGRKPIK